MTTAKHDAFTLVELLTVVAIMLIQFGLIMTLIGPGIRAGKETTVRSNLRQISAAAEIYANDNSGRIPWDIYYELTMLKPYFGTSVWSCPLDPIATGANGQATHRSGTRVSYWGVMAHVPIFIRDLDSVNPNYNVVAAIALQPQVFTVRGYPPTDFGIHNPILVGRRDGSVVKYLPRTRCYEDKSLGESRDWWGVWTQTGDPSEETQRYMHRCLFAPCTR